MKAIDISKWQPIVNWKKVKAAGIDTVILRAGSGKRIDPKFNTHIKGAIGAGLHIGIYWFSYAYSTGQAALEAKTCAEVLKPYKDHIDLPVFFDFEYDSINNASRHGVTTTKALVMQMTESFCKQIQKAGYKAGFYYNNDFFIRYYDVYKLNYFRWYARYRSTPDKNVSGCDIWQYTRKGRIDGISGNVDMDTIYNTKMIGKGAAASAGGSGKTTTSTNKKVSDTKMPTIKRGSKGQAVKVWQVIVGAEVDGSFGPETEAATKDFQNDHKLKDDGVVGDKTWKRGLESVK